MTFEVFAVTTGYSCTGCGCSLLMFQMRLLDPSKETLKKIARGILRMLSTATFYLYSHHHVHVSAVFGGEGGRGGGG